MKHLIDAIKRLIYLNLKRRNRMTNKKKFIAIEWHTDDVLAQRPDLTVEQANNVLDELDKNHDATVGINWDVIDCVTEMLYPEQIEG